MVVTRATRSQKTKTESPPHLIWTGAALFPRRSELQRKSYAPLQSIYYTQSCHRREEAGSYAALHRYERYDHRAAALWRNQLRQAQGNPQWEKKRPETVLISKDTAYIDASGKIVRETLTRPLRSEYDFLSTYIVPVLPDETVWVNDFPQSTNAIYTTKYFNHPGYNDYPCRGSHLGASAGLLRLAHHLLQEGPSSIPEGPES